MNNLVSFTCGACEATLSIPVELAGISGPCPYCGTHVTSPRPGVIPIPEANLEPRPTTQPPEVPVRLREDAPAGPRIERKARETTSDVPMRRHRSGLIAAAIVIVFVGGVAGAWRFWEAGESAPRNALPGMARPAPPPAVKPRPEVLVSASDEVPSDDTIPPPSEEMPRPVLSPVPAAVARNVSTAKPAAASAAIVTAPAGPESGLLPDIAPSTGGDSVLSAATGPPAEISEAEKQIRGVVPHSGQLEKPGTALIRFLAAPNWQERLKYTLAPDKVKPYMQAHYRVHADGPVIPDDIELTRVEPVEDDPQRNYYAFIIYLPGQYGGVPISVEETKTGCLVEWCSFVEGKDRLLAEFYAGYRKEAGTFRVLARRAHYFEKDVPDQDRKVVYDVFPPESSGPYKMWIDLGSVVYSRHFAKGERADWRMSTMMVVTLQWEKTADGVEYVRLADVVADSWHPGFPVKK